MKRFFSASLLVCMLSITSLAGEIPVGPGVVCETNCCQTNCTQAAETETAPIQTTLVELLAALLGIRV